MAMCLSSCDSFLEVSPSDKQTADQLYSSKSGYYTALNGIYDGLSSTTLYGQEMTWGAIDVLGKRYAAPTGNSAYQDISSGSLTTTYAAAIFSNIWENAYELILASNLLMDQIDKRDATILPDREAQLMKGELYAVRAFLHLDLLRLFGPVISENPTELSIPYNESSQVTALDLLPANEVIEKIICDLDEAETLLSTTDPVITDGPLASEGSDTDNVQLRYRQYRFNYYTVIALKARAYLWGNDKVNALAQAKRLLEDSTVQSYFPAVDPNSLLANSSNPDRVFSSEVLTGIYMKTRNTVYTSNFSPDASNYNRLQPHQSYVLGNLFSLPLFNMAESSSDYRFQSQWEASSIAGSQGYILTKYKAIDQPDPNDEDSEYFYAKMIPLVKMQEMYYIAAECEEDLTAQLGWYDAARARRGCSPSMYVTMYWQYGYGSVFLSNEIMREFYGEGQAYYFLKHTSIMGYPAGMVFYFDNGAEQGVSTSVATPPLPEGEMK